MHTNKKHILQTEAEKQAYALKLANALIKNHIAEADPLDVINTFTNCIIARIYAFGEHGLNAQDQHEVILISDLKNAFIEANGIVLHVEF